MKEMITDPYASLVSIMREQGAVHNPPAIQLAEVITPPPNLTIKVGDVQVDKDNILISWRCLPTYFRMCKLTGTFLEDGTLTFSASNAGSTNSVGVGDHGSHSHTITTLNVNSTNGHFAGTFEADVKIEFLDTLKAGDIVSVSQTMDKQTYIITDKVVRADE